ncbi:16S rRNA (guanine(966)-N(2))-methyltransferase RsmD [Heyndrickxia shackletonii]|uniref:16S rRNA (Guanine(966)-N(2))-methyltransferase RsmD n=1 Tax=Heyndrickxia shackletonii TaxID=157838 RepID=A0A0Q3TL91_9BACI|nr:16S rRNA (guanine(966)-N(2))-methyltransferase RsmD [Heyndrickxia shackletonii]KQL54742.1 16S rRNA (guanine(966)-N(2))-methyltransferase RsmD [Heyndrickxia shackletonii]NEY98397.1 16S rRNA (guanine(966)-N(2))-methyltransferase RsmD [Heyndrickxia shackletonii]
MRVISGSCKGKSLKSVPGNQTRPTTDKVKEAIFNMIGPYFSGGIGLDLFAGSGGLGIEAMSRGLDKVIFVDRDIQAFQTVKSNIKLCGFEEQSEIFRNDSERALKALIKRQISFDVIFLDPPYKKQKLVDLLQMISDAKMLSENGSIVCEHSSDLELPNSIGDFISVKTAKYGIIGLSIFQLDTYKGEELE